MGFLLYGVPQLAINRPDVQRGQGPATAIVPSKKHRSLAAGGSVEPQALSTSLLH